MEDIDLLLIDGKNLFWASGSIETETENGAVYRFLRTLLKIHNLIQAKIVICWEGGSRSSLFRSKLLPTYKRKPKNSLQIEIGSSIQSQFPNLQEVLFSIGIDQVKAKGWEADDCLATLASWGERRGYKVAIYSGDNDLCQCVTDKVNLVRKAKDKAWRLTWIDSKVVKLILGVEPSQVPFLKALMGDPADNYPGINKVGSKIGAKLVNHYGDFQSFFESAKKNDLPKMSGLGPKIKSSIQEEIQNGKLEIFYKIAQVNKQAPVEFLENGQRRPLSKLLIEMGMKSLVRQLELSQLRSLNG
jgi:5'-3' exonuclease